MARCEDFPCCGHAQDPGGCVDYSRINTCKDCGRQFHPDSLTENYCYVCGSRPSRRLPSKVAMTEIKPCEHCEDHDERAVRRGWNREPVPAAKWLMDKRIPLCDSCAEEMTIEWANDEPDMDYA